MSNKPTLRLELRDIWYWMKEGSVRDWKYPHRPHVDSRGDGVICYSLWGVRSLVPLSMDENEFADKIDRSLTDEEIEKITQEWGRP